MTHDWEIAKHVLNNQVPQSFTNRSQKTKAFAFSSPCSLDKTGHKYSFYFTKCAQEAWLSFYCMQKDCLSSRVCEFLFSCSLFISSIKTCLGLKWHD